MPTKGNPHISLRLKPQQITGLKIISKRTGVTVADLIREMIDTLLIANDLTPDHLLHEVAENDKNA